MDRTAIMLSIASFLEEFLRNWRVRCIRAGILSFPCYVGDAAKAIEAALKRGLVGQIYNISNQSISHKEANFIVSCLAHRSSWRVNFPGWMMIEFSKFLELVAFFTKREPFYPKIWNPTFLMIGLLILVKPSAS